MCVGQSIASRALNGREAELGLVLFSTPVISVSVGPGALRNAWLDEEGEEGEERFASAFFVVTCAGLVTIGDSVNGGLLPAASSLGGAIALSLLGLYPFPFGEVDVSGVGVTER